MPFTSASYTLTSLSDAPSYQLQLSMTGSPQGVLNISLYKNGVLHTALVYVHARSWDGTSWAQSGTGGAMTGGVRTYTYSSASAFDVQVYTDSSKAELLAASFVSYGMAGPKGLDGNAGSDGIFATPLVQYTLIREDRLPDASTVWADSLPVPWVYGLMYWMRTRYTWSDSTQANPHVTYGSPFPDHSAHTLLLNSLSFTARSNRSTYERNDRSVESSLLVLSADSRGYEQPSYLWLVNGVAHQGEQVILAIPKKGAPDAIEITCTMTYWHLDSEESLVRSLTLTAADVTEYEKSYGILDGPSTITDMIEGDCYVLRQGGDYIPQVYEGGVWVPITDQNAPAHPEAMSKCGNAVLLNGADIPVTSTALYAYYRTLYAQSANIEVISTRDLQIFGEGRIRSMGKTAIGDGSSGFIINSDGTSEFVGTVIRNADLSETRIERLDADVLRTVNEQRSGDTFTGNLASIPYWDLGTVMGDLIGRIAANAVVHKGGSFTATKVEGGDVSTAFSNVLHVTSLAERDKDRSLFLAEITTANAGTAFTVPALPAYTQSSVKLAGTDYLAGIASTGAQVSGKKQYSLDGGASWTDYESRSLDWATVKAKTVKLRQVLGGTLLDPGSAVMARVAGIASTFGTTPHMASGNGRMVVACGYSLYSMPVGNAPAASSYELSSTYPSTLGLAFGNGIFLAICAGTVQKRVLSGGANGTSWSELSSEAYDNLFFANGYFYAHVQGGGASDWKRSANGTGWTAAGFTCAHPFSSYSNDFMNSRFAYGNGVYIQVSYVTLSSASVWRSTDGQTWSAINIASTCPSGIAYGSGFFIAYEHSTPYYYASGDGGLTWSKRSLGYTPTKTGSAVYADSGANPASAGTTLERVFYAVDASGYLGALTLDAASPTSHTAGSLTASYSLGTYDVGVNLLDGEGGKISSHTTARDWYAGTFIFDGTDLSSLAGSLAYKFAGIFKAGVQVAAGAFDMFQSISIAWNRIYNSTDAPAVNPAIVSWSGTSLTITGAGGSSSRIRSNDLFSALSISFTVIAEAKGAYTKSLYPQGSSQYDIGVSTNPYHNVHADTFYGSLQGSVSGNVSGNVTGNVTGNVNGNVNAQGTANKVWGAVWN
jgi:hypothetical protein